MEEKFVRIAVATNGDKGIQDLVSHEFGHSRTFTIMDIEGGVIRNMEVIENPAKNVLHGRGPIVGKSLANKGVEVVITSEIGPGASAILEQLGVKIIITNPGKKVEDVLRECKLVK